MDKKFGQLEHIQASVNTIKTRMNSVDQNITSLESKYRLRAKKGPAPPPREFRRDILSLRKFQAVSFKRCLHSVLRGVSL